MKPRTLFVYLVMAIFVIFATAPIIWMVISSLKPEAEIYAISGKPLLEVFLPRPTLENYRWAGGPEAAGFQRYLMNSLTVSSIAAVSTVILTLSGGYSLARFGFKGKDAVSVAAVVSQMLPAILLVVPYYVLITRLGARDTYQGLMLVYIAQAIPFVLWLTRGFFMNIPVDLEEAAMVDGCSRSSAFLRIIVPLVLPGIIAAAIYAFTMSWNDYTYALVLTSTERSKTIQIGLQEFQGLYGIRYGRMMAFSFLATIPAVCLFVLAQKYLVKGLAKGAVKG